MGIKKKLQGVKETIVDYAEELKDVNGLSAEEYAAYYGGNYTNFLRAVNAKVFIAISERDSETESEEKENTESVTVEMKIASQKNGVLTFDEPKYLGQRETLEQNKIGFLLAKNGMSATIDTERNVLVIESRTILDKINDTKNEYMDKLNEKLASAGETITGAKELAKEKAVAFYQDNKEKAGGIVKRSLKKASDWAEKNL